MSRRDPYDRVVFVQGHRHSEPVCAWPDCQTYLTRAEMAALLDDEPAIVGRPSDEDMRAYLEGEHGPPHPEAVRIIQDALALATTCCCETSPPEFGGNLPDAECPLHGADA